MNFTQSADCYLCFISFRITHFPIKIVSTREPSKNLLQFMSWMKSNANFSVISFLGHKVFNLQMDGQMWDKFVLKCHADAFASQSGFYQTKLICAMRVKWLENRLWFLIFRVFVCIKKKKENFRTSNRWTQAKPFRQLTFFNLIFWQTNQSIATELLRHRSR